MCVCVDSSQKIKHRCNFEQQSHEVFFLLQISVVCQGIIGFPNHHYIGYQIAHSKHICHQMRKMMKGYVYICAQGLGCLQLKRKRILAKGNSINHKHKYKRTESCMAYAYAYMLVYIVCTYPINSKIYNFVAQNMLHIFA